MNNVLFIYNPNSGKRVISSQLDKFVGIFTEAGMIPTIARIGGTEDNVTVHDLIASKKFDGVIVAGGDGSVNTVIKTVLDTGSDIPVGIIPTGTCNDFSRSLGMPNDIIRCARLIAQKNIIRTDIGIINGGESIFVNELGGGVLASVSFSTDQNLKKVFGPLAYYLNGIGELANMKPFELKVTTPEKEYTEHALVFAILNGTDMSGFSNVIRDAQMQDGMMDILIFKDAKPIEITDSLLKFVSGGEFKEENVVRIRTNKCIINCAGGVSTTVDGEKGPGFPITLEMKKQAVQIYC